MMARRQLACGLGATMAGPMLAGWTRQARANGDGAAVLPAALAAIEAGSGGRLGVAVFDTQTGAGAGHRADERFPMCSTFKLLAVGAVLTRVDAASEHLDRLVHVRADDMVQGSPATQEHVGGTMSIAALCEAAITLSDNAAANLLLGALGGPPGVTEFAHSLGDVATRLDRTEIALNEALPGDPRDTTTPAAMLQDLRKLVLGDRLSTASRQQLTDWLLGNKTGATRLRAGVPADWRVGDKTGLGYRGTTNDIGLFWPPQRQPILVTAYLTEAPGTLEQRNATIASVARAVAAAFAG